VMRQGDRRPIEHPQAREALRQLVRAATRSTPAPVRRSIRRPRRCSRRWIGWREW
jgi:hypothetical protein